MAEFEADGDEIEVIANPDGRSLTIDGAREFGTSPSSSASGAAESDAFVVRAKRLDGDLWEVTVSTL